MEAVKSFWSFPTWIVPVKRLVVSEKTGEWCKLPYPNHPKGCPNYGKKATCPPQAPRLHHYFDVSRPMSLVHSEFDLEKHAKRMRTEHPQWSERQCRCLLYWQPTSRKQMRARTSAAMWTIGCNAKTECPEAMGLNVFATAAVSGLKLDRTRNIRTARHVCLIGWRVQ